MNRFVQYILIILLSLPLIVDAQKENIQKELKFNSIDSLFSYAERNSYVIKTNDQQTLLAKYQKVAAIINVVNFRDPVVFTLTNNTTLPVSFFPVAFAKVFGTTPGVAPELKLGQQYVSNANITPQIDIINAGLWAQVRSANINEALTSTTNSINKKSLYESIAACYYNIISFQEQVNITQKNLSASDTLLMIVNNKYTQGLVQQQDINNAEVNKLTLVDKLKELQISLEQQYNSLKILCDIPVSNPLVLESELNYDQQLVTDVKANSQLQFRSAALQAESARADLRFNRLSNLPVLSLLYNNAIYQNSNSQFFDPNPNNRWLNAVYVGAKVTFSLPDVNRIVSCRNSKVNYQISLINLEHNKLQNDIANEQLQLDYAKALSQLTMCKQIFVLKDKNYKIALDQYSQSILSTDKLLTTFNDMLLSRFNYSSALASLLYTKSKIDINNTIK